VHCARINGIPAIVYCNGESFARLGRGRFASSVKDIGRDTVRAENGTKEIENHSMGELNRTMKDTNYTKKNQCCTKRYENYTMRHECYTIKKMSLTKT
jgi:hypothetical protein